MRLLLRRIARTALLLACLCAGAVPAIAAPLLAPVSADFDGDGRRDVATLDRRDPALLRVWLSTTNATSEIRARRPIVRLAASDLDGDHKPELIGASTGPGLQVWTRKHARFHRYKTPAQRMFPAVLAIPHRRNVDDGPVSDRNEEGAPGSASALALLVVEGARPPTPDRQSLPACDAWGRPVAPARHALAPRPPPVQR